jgi:hypothetical protein
MNKDSRGERGGNVIRDKSLDDRRGRQQLECEEKAQYNVPNRKKSGKAALYCDWGVLSLRSVELIGLGGCMESMFAWFVKKAPRERPCKLGVGKHAMSVVSCCNGLDEEGPGFRKTRRIVSDRFLALKAPLLQALVPKLPHPSASDHPD